MVNEAPYEVISAPGTLYIAAVGAEFPELHETPGMGWALVGTSGDMNYTDAGITVAMPQTINKFRPLGSTVPTKKFRSEEDLMVRAVLADLTLEQLALVLNGNVPTLAAGVGKIGLYRGTSVKRYALLLRFDFSPYRIDGQSQYEIPIVTQDGQPEVVFRRGTAEPAALALEFGVVADPAASSIDERSGRFVAEEAET